MIQRKLKRKNTKAMEKNSFKIATFQIQTRKQNMKEIKLHAGGENDYLNSLKEKYKNLKNNLINNKNITEKERIEKFKKNNEKFENAKKDLTQKLF